MRDPTPSQIAILRSQLHFSRHTIAALHDENRNLAQQVDLLKSICIAGGFLLLAAVCAAIWT